MKAAGCSNPAWRRAARCAFACFAAAALASAGCSSAPEGTVRYSGAHPLIRFTNSGLRFDGRPVTPKEAVELLEERQIPKSDTIHLLVDEDYTNDRAMWVFQHNYLGKAGYRKTVQVRERKSDGFSAWEREHRAERRAAPQTPPARGGQTISK